jgi:hypothetical protein
MSSPVVVDPDGVHLRWFLTLDVQLSGADRGRAGPCAAEPRDTGTGSEPRTRSGQCASYVEDVETDEHEYHGNNPLAA